MTMAMFAFLFPFSHIHKVISYGAMIYSVKVPSKTGDIADVALGYDTIEGMKLKIEMSSNLSTVKIEIIVPISRLKYV